jgi:monodehydroascorbate reductase (NADH)
LPYFYSREFSLAWHFWGSSAPSDTVVHWGDASPAAAMAAASGGTPAKFGAYWVRGGVVVGVFVEGATPEEMAAAKAVASSRPAAPGEGVLAQQGIGWACACKL